MYMNHTTDSSSETLGLRDMAPVASLPITPHLRDSLQRPFCSNLSLFAEVLYGRLMASFRQKGSDLWYVIPLAKHAIIISVSSHSRSSAVTPALAIAVTYH
jgi:hypothetical protein